MSVKASGLKEEPTDSPSTSGEEIFVRERVKTHPPTSEMVIKAMDSLNQRKGVSKQAITKFVKVNYNVNQSTITSLVNRYLRLAVSRGDLIQATGVGATGSFKLPKVPKERKAGTNAKPISKSNGDEISTKKKIPTDKVVMKKTGNAAPSKVAAAKKENGAVKNKKEKVITKTATVVAKQSTKKQAKVVDNKKQSTSKQHDRASSTKKKSATFSTKNTPSKVEKLVKSVSIKKQTPTKSSVKTTPSKSKKKTEKIGKSIKNPGKIK